MRLVSIVTDSSRPQLDRLMTSLRAHLPTQASASSNGHMILAIGDG